MHVGGFQGWGVKPTDSNWCTWVASVVQEMILRSLRIMRIFACTAAWKCLLHCCFIHSSFILHEVDGGLTVVLVGPRLNICPYYSIFQQSTTRTPPQSELFTFVCMKLRSKSRVSQQPRLLSSTTKAVNWLLAAKKTPYTFSSVV